eukprot:gnl/TRDRNA2_/TRDRNA2_138652_c1_seq1.p2 gnl/TRDRNA2_/TRDRNA2_138652_c1~~gnl/TRDRNA2_/TRDRNA2_138652_c1_seq1.p2  ORF type:complete len:172 (+),score=10.36 gnl/TRDRNA2_/TRDRNA2_138652_c1_seq1:440-955(+)
MQSYTYARLQLLPHGSTTVMGFSAVCMIVSEIPFFYYSGRMATRFGVMPIIAFALLCMFVRQLWIVLLWDAWFVLPGELLHGITYSVANAATVLHCKAIAPESIRNTAQSVQFAVFVGFGWGFAAFIGSAVISRWGVITLFQASACFALAASFLLCCLCIRGHFRPADSAC